MDPSNNPGNIPWNNDGSNEDACVERKKRRRKIYDQKRNINSEKLKTLQTLATTQLNMAQSHTHMATITERVGSPSPATPFTARTEDNGAQGPGINHSPLTLGRGIKRNIFSTKVDRASMVLIPGMASDEEILRIDAAERGVEYHSQQRVEEQERATGSSTSATERCWCKGWCNAYACGCFRSNRACTSKCRNCATCVIGCKNLSKDLLPEKTKFIRSSPSPTTKGLTPTKTPSSHSEPTPASPFVATSTTSFINSIPAESDLASSTTTSTTTSSSYLTSSPTTSATSSKASPPTIVKINLNPTSTSPTLSPKDSNSSPIVKVVSDPTYLTRTSTKTSPTSLTPNNSATQSPSTRGTIVKIHMDSQVACFKTAKLDAAGLIALLQLYFSVSKFVLQDLDGIIEPIYDHMEGEFYLIKR